MSEHKAKRSTWSRFSEFCRRHGFNPSIFAFILILLLIIIGLIVFIAVTSRSSTGYESKTIDFGLQDIGELSTQAGYYTNVNMITKDNRTIGGVSVPFTSSKAIMTYSGTIRAGLDFEKIDISIDPENQTVTFSMPPTRILSNEVDLNSFELFDEYNSIFNQISIDNYNLSLAEMKTRAEQQAIANGILDAARSNAEILVRSVFNNTVGAEGYQAAFTWKEQ